MQFKKTTENDISKVLRIFDGARKSMRAQGIDQWQNGYPEECDIRADIEAGVSYVLCDEDGEVLASCAVILSGEPTYTKIKDGAWLTTSTDGESCGYVAVHRVATDKDVRGRGLASRMLSEAAILGKKAGKISLRIDTHRDNRPMQRMLSRNGLVYCGTVTIEDGSARNAYEKLL